MKKIFAILFALPLLFVACDNGDDTQKQSGNEPTLELTSDATMNFDAEGGAGVITYNLIKGDEALNGDSGISSHVSPIIIRTEQEWITIIKDESIYGTIKFEVAANTTDEERTGTITGTYHNKSIEVTINQAAGPFTPAMKGWAIVGSMTNNWDVESGVAMEAIDGYFVARGVEITTTDSFKFVKDGDMQNSLGGNGHAAERDFKYPASKYGSDIRVKETDTYDLYINEVADTYYVMSEGKTPAEAQEVVEPGKDIWYVKGLGEEITMNKVGVFLVASDVEIDEDGFTLRNTIIGECGAKEDVTYDIDSEIELAVASGKNIVVNYEAGKSYDIYLKAETLKVWVVPTGMKPNILNECYHCEGAWFSVNKNFYLYLKADGINLTIDCMLAEAANDHIIPETTFVVAFGENRNGKNYIDSDGSEIANESGKTKIVSGELSVKHCEEGYDITIDLINHLQHRIRAHYTGEIRPDGLRSAIVTPNK